MPNKWFDSAHYATQKVAQMNEVAWDGKSDWAAGSWPEALAAYNTANNTSWTDLQNFQACNTSGYASTITKADINVSPNALFDIPVYLANVAAYANTAGANGGVWTDPAQPSFPAGGIWTAENVLDYLVKVGTSAWQHYITEGTKNGINPSNGFDTNAYLTAKAELLNASHANDTTWTAETVAADLAARGVNAIQDMYDWNEQNPDNQITATSPAQPTTPPADFHLWGAGSPEGPDPWGQIENTVNLEDGVLQYPAEGAAAYTGNTLFAAQYGDSTTNTLSPNDAINGGSGQYNTLEVLLGSNFDGFTSPGQDADGNDLPNITNIGRLKLDHIKTNTELSYNFDATGIDGLKRVDLNDTGAGALSVSGLQSTVTEVNISGILAADNNGGVNSTNIGYASDGPDALTIGLSDVAKAGVVPITVNQDIETLTINAKNGSNSVDLSGIGGVTTLNVKGAGDLNVAAVTEGITKYDASAATGDIKFTASSDIDSKAVVIGGQGGNDVLVLSEAAVLKPAAWSGIENLHVSKGTTLDCVNVKDLQALWVTGDAAQTLTNVKETDFVIQQTAATTNQVTVNGTIENLWYVTAAAATKTDPITINGGVSSSVTGDVTVDILANTKYAGANAIASFNKAAGNVALNVAKGAEWGTGTANEAILNATSASSFTAVFDGTLKDGTVLNVIGGSTSPNVSKSLSITANNGMEAIDTGTKIQATGATDLSITSVGQFQIADGSELNGARMIDIQLVDGTTNAGADTFKSEVNLEGAQNVTIDSTGMNVVLKQLGNAQGNGALVVNVENAADFEVGSMLTNTGWNINADITATGDVKLGEEVSTNAVVQTVNKQGDVSLTVNATSVATGGDSAEETTLSGDAISVDLSGVTGTAFAADTFFIDAAGAVNYIGAADSDNVTIENLGGKGSTIRLGGGDDIIKFDHNNSSVPVPPTPPAVSVNLYTGAGADEISVTAWEGSNLIVNLQDFVQGEDKVTTATTAGLTDSTAVALLSKFGIANLHESSTAFTLCKVGTTDDAGVIYAGKTYFQDADADVLYCINGVFEEVSVN